MIKNENIVYAITPISFFLFLIVVIIVVMMATQVGDVGASFAHSQDQAKEYFWRLFWSALLVLIVLYSVVMCWHAIQVIRDNIHGLNTEFVRELSWSMAGIIGIVVAYLVFSDSTIGAVAYFLNNDINLYMYDNVKFLFGISSATVMLVTFSMGFVLFVCKDLSIEIIQKKNRAFKRSFYITAGYLGIGVVHFYSLFTWASYSLGVLDTHKILIYAVTIAASILYTLVFVVMFVPVSIRIRSWIERIAIKEGVDVYNPEELARFKKQNGLYDSPRNNLKQLAVLLSPVFIGILSGVVGQIFQLKTTGG